MEEKLESKEPKLILECGASHSCYFPAADGWHYPKGELKGVYQVAAEKGIEPDKTTGLFFDSVKENYCAEKMPNFSSMSNLSNKEKPVDSLRGMYQEEKEIPEIVTLEEKAVAYKSYKKVLALAGVAVRHQKTMFDEMENEIVKLRKCANAQLNVAKKLEIQLENLKKLAVLD